MAKNRVKLRWPEHPSGPFEQVTSVRQRKDRLSPEAAEVLAIVAARHARHDGIARKAPDAASLENARLRASRLRVNTSRPAGLSYQDKITATAPAWDGDNGAGVKRTRQMVAEPTGYTARAAADVPPPKIGLSEAAIDDLHAQRAWKR